MFGWLRSKKSRHRALARIDLMSVRNSLITKAGWEVGRARTAEAAYREFLALMIDWPDETHVPTRDVDDFWHWHLLDSAKYERDCKAVFGKVIHHDPHLQKGTPAHTAAFAQTQERLASRAPARTASTAAAQAPVSGTIPASCGGGVDPLLMTALLVDDGGGARSDPSPAPSYSGPAEAPDPSPSYDGGSYGGSSYGGSDSGSSGGSSCSSGSSSSCSSASCGGGGCGGGGGD